MVNDTSFFFSRNVFLMRFHKTIKQFLKSILGQNIYKMSFIIPTMKSILFKKNIRNVTQFLSKGHMSDHICNIPLETHQYLVSETDSGYQSDLWPFPLFLNLSSIWREISSQNWTKRENLFSKTDIFSLLNMVNCTFLFFSRNVLLMHFHKAINYYLK